MRTILAIDPGTHCGWAMRTHTGAIHSGTWDLSPGRGRVYKTRWANLLDKLRETHELHSVDHVVSEAPFIHHKHPAGARVGFGLVAVIELWAEVEHIECEQVENRILKKHATGKGNATKESMLAAAMDLWPGQRIETQDQADALLVLDWAMSREHR